MHTIIHALIFSTVIITLLYSGLILLHVVSWSRLNSLALPDKKPVTRVSIIVPARDEERNIEDCLASIISQEYPSELMEIIVCDDQSTDHTKDIALKTMGNAQLQFKYIPVTSNPSNKKKAIEAGIQASSGELLIFTDADCTAEKTWISAMVSAYEKTGAKMLCGPVAFKEEKNMRERFQGLEMCGLSLLSGAGINAGMPLLCNGANIAYTRSAYDAVEGFKGIDDIPSGDDTLMLFKINKKFPGSIHYVKTRLAIVSTYAQPDWTAFIQQRIRWASKGLRSKNTLNSGVSLLVFLANFLLLVSLIPAFIYPQSIPILGACVILKFTVDFLLLTFGSVFFNKKKLLLTFLVSELITMLYTCLVGLTAPYTHYQWKGRNY